MYKNQYLEECLKNKKGVFQMNNIKTKEQIQRDNYYKYLFQKYNCYDVENIIDIITNSENETREELELACLR